MKELEKKNLTYQFDFNGSYPYSQMLKDQVEGKVNSWAIRWNASAFLKNKYTLYPGKSLVINNGTDGSGVHCISTEEYNSQLNLNAVELKKIPVEESSTARKAIEGFFKPVKKPFLAKLKGVFGLKSGV